MRTSSIDAWVFHLGDDPDAWKKNAEEAAFRPVRIPHDWAVEQPFDQSCSSGTGYLPGGIGWYRAHCSITALGLGEANAVRLVFHGVYKRSQVWVNGYHVGGRASGHAEFSFDLTEIVGYAPDDDLVISVRVDHRDLADSRWYNGSGITRRVEIEAHGAVSLARHGCVVTTLSANQDRAEIEVVQQWENHTADVRQVTVHHVLERAEAAGFDPEHRGQHSVAVPALGLAELRSVIEVSAPLLWSDDHPHLYRLITTRVDGDQEVARHEDIVGIRTFAFDPDTGFSINGERRILKGVCLHEDAGPLGVAVPPAVWLRRLLVLKEGGCNAVRMAHNSHSPELYDLCDLVGLYVIDEAFDEWENPKNKWWQGHNVYPPKHEGYAHDYPEWHVRDLEAMIDAHRNHPSVIAWSIGNEVDYPNDPYVSEHFTTMTGNNDANKPEAERVYDRNRPDIRRLTTIANELIDIVKARDSSRPVTFAAAFPELSSLTGLLDRLDLIGYNYKEHLYADDHRRFPNQPFVGSENSHTYAAWRHVVDQEFVAGQFLWTGIDYLGETPGWPSHGSAAGLLTTAGLPKERWHLRRSWWSDEPTLRLAVRPVQVDPNSRQPFTRDWTVGAELEVACFTNADEVIVSRAGEPVEMTYDTDRGFWRGEVIASDDPITATATIGGATQRDELRHGVQPAALTAKLWEAPAAWIPGLQRIVGGSEPVQQVHCQLVDDQGQPAGGALEVSVVVTGGELLGIDNGDLTDTTAYATDRRRTLDGNLMVYVRGAGATVTLRAAGLADAILQTPTG